MLRIDNAIPIASENRAGRCSQQPLHAFTLIELLVVVAIIALLVSILLPSMKKARDQTKRLVCASNLHQQAVAFFLYQHDFKLLPHPQVVTAPNGGYPIGYLWPTGGLYTMTGEVAEALVNDYGLANPKIWQCPANNVVPYRGFERVSDGTMQYWAGADFLFFFDPYAVYTYLDGSVWPVITGNGLANGALSATHVNQSSDHAMIGDITYNYGWLLSANHLSRGRGPDWILLDNPIVDGWNLGYGDGHVEWIGKTPSDQQLLFHYKNRKYGPYWFFCTW